MNVPFILDKQVILERLGGDEELLVTMSDLFLEESEDYCRNLDQALLAADADRLRREAHTVKSLLATFVDEDGKELALNVEMRAKSGQMDGISDAVEQLKARVRLVCAVIRQELGLG